MARAPVSLPDVTVVVIDTVAHDLARAALVDTLREVEPAEVLIWSDRRITLGHETIPTEIGSYAEFNAVLWYDVPHRVRTSHVLIVQWDGWVLDGSRWDPEWLETDYVGAPWWYGDGRNVGNGGFSLRSTDLMRWVAKHPGRYPTSHPEDDAICRRYRGQLEVEGFTWADQSQAERFAFERTTPRPAFGFHGCWHWPTVLDHDGLSRRFALANDYVRGKVDWRELMMAARL